MDQHGLEPLTEEELAERRKRSKKTAIILLAVAMTGGVLVMYGYLNYLRGLQEKSAEINKLPILSRLEDNLVATERSGETVELKELRGKVLVAGHVYTRCPRGCFGLAAIMKDLQKELGESPNLHFLSFTVDPMHDGPDELREFAKIAEIEGDNWWLLTDQENPKGMHKYLAGQFRFRPTVAIPEEERLNEFDLWSHDMRLALVDHEGHVRFHYMVLDPESGEEQIRAMKNDIKQLLGEVGSGSGVGKSPVIFYAIIGLAVVFVIGMIAFRKKEAGAGQ